MRKSLVICPLENIQKLPDKIEEGDDFKIVILCSGPVVDPKIAVCTELDRLLKIRKICGKYGKIVSIAPQFGGLPRISREIVNSARNCEKTVFVGHPDTNLQTWICDGIRGLGKTVTVI